jgi:short-subunit dehydrogenase
MQVLQTRNAGPGHRGPAGSRSRCSRQDWRNLRKASDNFRTFAIMHTAHRTLTHRLQRRVIQSSCIVLFHARRESYSQAAPQIAHHAHVADLLSLGDTKQVGARIAAEEPRIDVLINNAGNVFAHRG